MKPFLTGTAGLMKALSVLAACAWLLLPPAAQGIVDANGNGISDLFEMAWNSGQLPVPPISATGDEDGDGVSNLHESIAGSDYTDGKDSFRLLITYRPAVFITPPGGGDPELLTPETALLTWSPLLPQKQYTVSYSPDLGAGGWIEIARFLADGSQTGQAVALTQPGGGVPPKGFFRVSADDVDSPSNPGYTRHELHLLGLDPDAHHPGLPPAGGPGGDGGGPGGPGNGAGDSALPGNSLLNWPRTPENKYLWIPVDPAGPGYHAVDMGESGHILFQVDPIDPDGLPTDYLTRIPGKTWHLSRDAGERLRDLHFNPSALTLRMLQTPDPDDEGGNGDLPIVASGVPLPLANSDTDNHRLKVAVHSIGADGSVMANVSYSYTEDQGAHPESPDVRSSPWHGRYVFVWPGDVHTCELLGTDRGYRQNGTGANGLPISTWTTNDALGFLSERDGGDPKVKALVFDQDNGTDPVTDLGVLAYPIIRESGSQSTVGSSGWHTGFADRATNPALDGHPHLHLTPGGRFMIPWRDSPQQIRLLVDSLGTRTFVGEDLPATSLTDLPSGGWAIGVAGGNLRLPSGTGFVETTGATGVLRLDRQGNGIGDGVNGRHMWQNGEWRTLAQATGIENFPEDLRPRKITAEGLVWASNDEGTINGILLPVEVVDKDKKAVTKLKVGKMAEPGVLMGTGASATLDIDKDADRFYIRVPGGAALGGISVKVSTTDNPDSAYDDNATQIDLRTDGNDAISKSLLLVSDDVDDNHPVDGIADDATGDRTHKVQLGGNFRIEEIKIGTGAWRQTDIKVPVPFEKTVKVKLVNCREGRIFVDPCWDANEITFLKAVLKERYAQAGIELTFSVVAGPNIGNNGWLKPGQFPTDVVAGVLDVPQKTKDIINGGPATSLDEVTMYLVRRLHISGGVFLAGAAIPPKYLSPENRKYGNKILMGSMGARYSVHFAGPHEMLHILADAIHDDFPIEFGDRTMMWYRRVSNADTIDSTKRISKNQGDKMLLNDLAQ